MRVPSGTVVVRYNGGPRTKEQAEREGRPPIERTRNTVEDVVRFADRADFGKR